MKNILKFEEDDDYIEIRRESKILNSHFLLIFWEIRYVFGVRWLLFPMQGIVDLRNILDFIWKVYENFEESHLSIEILNVG